MDENLDKKISKESRIVEFLKDNKFKILFTILFDHFDSFFDIFFNFKMKKKNTQISEQIYKGRLVASRTKK